jgi:phage shock protein PspC (stress-responsive transcriptional regulator)
MTSDLMKGPNRLYRSQNYKALGGVCAGIAIQKKWPVALVRLSVIALSSLTGIFLVAYLVAWLLVPSSRENPDFDRRGLPEDAFLRSRDDAMMAGLCSALAKHFDWDVAVVRVLFVILSLLGGGLILAYIVGWLVVPRAP